MKLIDYTIIVAECAVLLEDIRRMEEQERRERTLELQVDANAHEEFCTHLRRIAALGITRTVGPKWQENLLKEITRYALANTDVSEHQKIRNAPEQELWRWFFNCDKDQMLRLIALGAPLVHHE